jgi:hypothetical protein
MRCKQCLLIASRAGNSPCKRPRKTNSHDYGTWALHQLGMHGTHLIACLHIHLL